MPTPSKPLTHSFPGPGPETDLPLGHHPATPRFLLSLLATAVYLSIPSTASQALNAILSSVGPHTVVPYLNFAIGKPIEPPRENEPVAAIGLESLAKDIQEDAAFVTSASICSTKQDRGTDSEQMSQKLEDLDIKKEDPSESSSDCSYDHQTPEPFFHYGAVSDKIGEATACWLARWGPDILSYEEKIDRNVSIPVWTLGTRPISFENTSNDVTCPVIWARGGLNAKWIRALVSSDALFVKGERERYDFAKSVVDLRRRCGIDEEEEEWTKMFSTGIYYAHMVGLDMLATFFFFSDVLFFSHWTTSSCSHEICRQL